MTSQTTRVIGDTTFHIRTQYLKHFRIIRNLPNFNVNNALLGLKQDEYYSAVHIFHCTDGPAISSPRMTDWIQYGKRHRPDNLPSSNYSQLDNIEYRVDGQLHRLDGPAATGGTDWWYRYGRLHRDDGPAIDDGDCNAEWYQDGRRHRADGPAIDDGDFSMQYYQYGKLHRVDGPAQEFPQEGTYVWAQNGKHHRQGDEPAVDDGYEIKYYQFGKLHRTAGPAHERTYGFGKGNVNWYYNDKLHRLNGPAVIKQDAKPIIYEWWRNGVRCDNEAELADEYYQDRIGSLDTHLPVYGSKKNWLDSRPLLMCIRSYMEFEIDVSETRLYKNPLVDDGKGDVLDWDDYERTSKPDADDSGEHRDLDIYENYDEAYASDF
jgi:hypothetical protein